MKIDKFFRKVIKSNILALQESKDIMIQITRATRYKNWHSIIKIYKDIIFVIKFLVAKIIFKKILSHNLRDNGKNIKTDFNILKKNDNTKWQEIFLYKIIFVKYKKIRHKLENKLQRVIEKQSQIYLIKNQMILLNIYLYKTIIIYKKIGYKINQAQ